MITRSIDHRSYPYLPKDILLLKDFLVRCLSSLPAERYPLAEGFLGSVFKFVYEAPLPAALVPLHSGAHPQEQQQILRELTQFGQFLAQQKHHLRLQLEWDDYDYDYVLEDKGHCI